MKTRIIKRKGTLLSSVAMLSTAMLLTACGGDGGDSPVDDGGANPGESGAQALLYAYPDNGQNEVSTAAPVVLRFSSAVNLGEAQNSITVYEGDAQSGTMVAVTPETVAGEPNNVLLQSDEDLKPNQTYTVVIEDLRLRKGTAKDQTLTFTTRPLHEGPKSLVVKEDTFEVSRRMPDGSAMEPVMDFSSFRFQFTQPIDRATANYGDGNTVVLRDGAGDPVDATLLIDGAYMTVDPDAEYLNAGETYTLDITADLASTYGETFGAQSYTLTPKDSSPKGEPAILVQKLTQGTTSRLTGKPVNEVPVNGTLLGENKNITQASAEVVRAELADVTTYTDVTPIRLPKGTVLNGAEISPILIGGEVPAGFGSGDVTMTVLSDASGYLVPNPYAGNNPDALRIVHLLMDVGIATSEARANGAFTQDLLHIELVGLAEVDPTAGVLNLDAVSVVEPNILGQEYGYGMLSFQLQSYKDQSNPPQIVGDTTAPTLQSWMPGDNADLQQPGDPIVLNFSEPLNPESIKDKVLLLENDSEMDISSHVDGGALIIKPLKPLRNSRQGQVIEYELQLAPGITDLAGNQWNESFTGQFHLPEIIEEKSIYNGFSGPDAAGPPVDAARSPFVLAVYPGYPCLLDTDSWNLSEDDAGRCKGGLPGSPSSMNSIEDDHIPVSEIPANRPIVVTFSKDIKSESVRLGESFKVQRISPDVSGSVIEEVPGELSVEARRIMFWPHRPWEKNEYYKYELGSNGSMTSSVANCDGTSAICSTDGLPLQTQMLADISVEDLSEPNYNGLTYLVSTVTPPADTGGGDNMIQVFKGADASDSVLQVLRTAPVSDVNANLVHDANRDLDSEELATIIWFFRNFNAYSGSEESGPTSIRDPNADEALDPNGVLPAVNSAKVISTLIQADKASDLPDAPTNVDGGQAGFAAVFPYGSNVGCGFQSYEETVDQPAFCSDVGSVSACFRGVPAECPKEKFTYLTGGLTAEITSEYVDGRGIKVLLWPGTVMTTALNVVLKTGLVPADAPVDTGYQVMRMRYSKDETGQRTQPIVGYISNDDNGAPMFNASVDLYLNAPLLSNSLKTLISNGVKHNFYSYPLTLDLSGPVNFLSDGRMIIEQYNLNPMDLELRSDNPVSEVNLRIPEQGSYLQYLAEPIK